MKITNWHKRNTGAARKFDGAASVCNGGENHRHVQINIRGEKGRLDLTLTPDESRKLIRELEHCTKRYE